MKWPWTCKRKSRNILLLWTNYIQWWRFSRLYWIERRNNRWISTISTSWLMFWWSIHTSTRRAGHAVEKKWKSQTLWGIETRNGTHKDEVTAPIKNISPIKKVISRKKGQKSLMNARWCCCECRWVSIPHCCFTSFIVSSFVMPQSNTSTCVMQSSVSQ